MGDMNELGWVRIVLWSNLLLDDSLSTLVWIDELIHIWHYEGCAWQRVPFLLSIFYAL